MNGFLVKSAAVARIDTLSQLYSRAYFVVRAGSSYAIHRCVLTLSADCLLDKIQHLYEIQAPANLESRFKLVDLGAIAFPVLLEEKIKPDSSVIGPIPYIGGKNRIANAIIKLFPEHRTYCEPFCGGGQLLFHKEPSKVEVL